MRHVLFALSLSVLTTTLPRSRRPLRHRRRSSYSGRSSSPAAVKDLPVRKVVLYKNGVGYFEHAGT